jgi:hypothetical protein
MKSLFAALLLVFQLQPVLGAAACLGLVQQPAQQECKMPEHGSMPSNTVSGGEPMSPASCALATACTPAPLAIPALTDQVVRAVPSQAMSLISASNAPTDFNSVPPLPPPRV